MGVSFETTETPLDPPLILRENPFGHIGMISDMLLSVWVNGTISAIKCVAI